MRILGIETSCDNTSLAVLDDNKNILFSNNYHQNALIRKYGGYIPHMLGCYQSYNIVYALMELKQKYDILSVDYISVTTGPGMMFSLAVGYKVAHVLSNLIGKPLFYCDHIEGHMLSVFIEHNISFPYLCIVISGGHCLFVYVNNLGDYTVIGQTVDDSPGEVFDKVAKELQLQEYNGYYVSLCAKDGILIKSLMSTHVKIKNHKFCCSFSGFKTRIICAIRSGKYSKHNIAYTIQHLIVSHILNVVKEIHLQYNNIPVVFVGGVSANAYLREKARIYFKKAVFTSIKYATDNAEMIANVCLMYKLQNKNICKSYMCYSQKPYDMVVFRKSNTGV